MSAATVPCLPSWGNRWGNGTFRFAALEEAEAKFAGLLSLPGYAQEAAEAENLTIGRRKLAQQYAHSGRAALERFRRQLSPFVTDKEWL
jgi:hypothetical protein